MARVLIVGGGCRGRQLASMLVDEGHAVRITTRSQRGRAQIEQVGAECFLGDPDRLATLRASLEHVTVACWLLAGARGTSQQLRALHASRPEHFLSQAIDTTLRGFVYECPVSASGSGGWQAGERAVRAIAAMNAIPAAFLTADPCDLARMVVAGARGRRRPTRGRARSLSLVVIPKSRSGFGYTRARLCSIDSRDARRRERIHQ